MRVVRHFYLGPLGLAHCCVRFGYNVECNKLPKHLFITHCVLCIIAFNKTGAHAEYVRSIRWLEIHAVVFKYAALYMRARVRQCLFVCV